jgi:hypothetical protein
MDPEPDPGPKEIILEPDPRDPKCYGSYGSRSGTLLIWRFSMKMSLLTSCSICILGGGVRREGVIRCYHPSGPQA